jgi:ADP-ribosylation factor-like protein 2
MLSVPNGVLVCRYKLNVWDVGGQKTIRSYWRNYFEQTDGIIWVVDSADRRRLRDCKEELATILTQEVRGCVNCAFGL